MEESSIFREAWKKHHTFILEERRALFLSGKWSNPRALPPTFQKQSYASRP
jgi:hypothetical protein